MQEKNKKNKKYKGTVKEKITEKRDKKRNTEKMKKRTKTEKQKQG